MIKACCIGVIGTLLLAAGCGSKDATGDGKAGADAGADSKTVGTDAAGTPDSRQGDLERDSALAPEDAPVSPPIDAAEADASREPPKLDGPKAEALSVDMIVEAGKADVAADTSPAPPSFTCRNDSDCCIKLDTCMNVAYLYSKAPGASPAPEIPASTPGSCTKCIPPSVQVRCVNSQCTGEKLPMPTSGPMPASHCGPLLLDAGASAYHDLPSDAGAPAPRSSWTCGG
jgi:hypothetical protein